MRQIKINTLALEAAPIDGKNILEEALFEDIFDQTDYVVSSAGDYVGFVMNEPAYAMIIGNRLKISFMNCSNPSSLLISGIIQRLTGCRSDNIQLDVPQQYINDDEVYPLIYTFRWSRATYPLSLSIHYAPEDYNS